MRPAGAVGQQQNGEGMVVMDAEKNIRKQRDIFGAGIPFSGQAPEAWKAAPVGADLRLIDGGSLAGIALGIEDVVMVLQPRIAVQGRVNEGKVVGLAIILDREFPVAVEREADRGIGAGMDKRMVELAPAFDERGGRFFKGRCRAADIHENDVAPDMRANTDQRQITGFDAVMAVDIGAADMRCAAQIAVEIIGPGVIGAGDRSPQPDRFLDQDHAAVSADILEHVDSAVGVPDHQHRNAKKRYRFRHAGRCDVLAEPDRGPAVAEHPVLFLSEHAGIDIAFVRKAVRRFDRRHDVAQICHHGYPLQASIAAGSWH